MKEHMQQAIEACRIVAEDLNVAGADSLADNDILSASEDAKTEMAVMEAIIAMRNSTYMEERHA